MRWGWLSLEQKVGFKLRLIESLEQKVGYKVRLIESLEQKVGYEVRLIERCGQLIRLNDMWGLSSLDWMICEAGLSALSTHIQPPQTWCHKAHNVGQSKFWINRALKSHTECTKLNIKSIKNISSCPKLLCLLPQHLRRHSNYIQLCLSSSPFKLWLESTVLAHHNTAEYRMWFPQKMPLCHTPLRFSQYIQYGNCSIHFLLTFSEI